MKKQIIIFIAGLALILFIGSVFATAPSKTSNQNNIVYKVLETVKENSISKPCCTPYWKVGDWGYCSHGKQTRTVIDLNNCKTDSGKPVTSQSCSKCTPNWDCSKGPWGSCINGLQSRVCTDTDNCGIDKDKPLTYKTCTVSHCTPCWQTSAWGTCSPLDYMQHRTVIDLNHCGTLNGEPAIAQSCKC